MTTEGEFVSESVLVHHAGRIGVDPDEMVASATADGIITDVERVRKHEVAHRYELAGSLEDFCIYAERLLARGDA